MSPQELTSMIPYSDIALEMCVIEWEIIFPEKELEIEERGSLDQPRYHLRIVNTWIITSVVESVNRILHDSIIWTYSSWEEKLSQKDSWVQVINSPDELKHYIDLIEKRVIPFIKERVDDILHNSSLWEYTDEEISFAIISLRNFFYSNKWFLLFHLTCERNPYILEWIHVLENKE